MSGWLSWLMLACGLVVTGLIWLQACREDARRREAAAELLRRMDEKRGAQS